MTEEYLTLHLPLRLTKAELEEVISSVASATLTAGERAGDEQLRTKAVRFIAMRRKRANELGTDLFGEPAWDLLLDLLVQKLDGKKTCVTSACIGANAPPTTALRYLAALQQAGLINRRGCKRDSRIQYVELTDKAFEALSRLLAEI